MFPVSTLDFIDHSCGILMKNMILCQCDCDVNKFFNKIFPIDAMMMEVLFCFINYFLLIQTNLKWENGLMILYIFQGFFNAGLKWDAMRFE